MTRRDMSDQYSIMTKLGSSLLWITGTNYFLLSYLKHMCDNYEKNEGKKLIPVKVGSIGQFFYYCCATHFVSGVGGGEGKVKDWGVCTVHGRVFIARWGLGASDRGFHGLL